MTTSVNTLALRLTALEGLLARLGPVPDPWTSEQSQGTDRGITAGGGLTCLDCSTYRELQSAWRKALRWTDGLDCALSVMLASSASTMSVGEQLWVKVIGPPSSGKTTLVEGLAVNTKYVLSKSTIRGFHSGWKSPDGKDTSLVAQIHGKTLATKDGDALLQSPNLGQILSEARDLYDRTSRTSYRNAEGNDYVGIRMTWLLCGTSSLREIDESELGARFIDCVIMDDIDEDFEDEVGWRAANQEDRNMGMESDGGAVNQYTPELGEAMRLTGGYVGYLRENAIDLLSEVIASEKALRKCARLGLFIAFMRARPSKKNADEKADREFSPRLIKQQVRLAKCLAIVLNRKTLDDEVMRRVTKVAMDTSRGQTLQIVEHLIKAHHGMESRALSIYTNRTEEKTRQMLRYLRQIGIVEMNIEPAENGSRSKRNLWKLTPRLTKLYHSLEDE